MPDNNNNNRDMWLMLVQATMTWVMALQQIPKTLQTIPVTVKPKCL